MKRFVEYLAEAITDGPRIPHPEDSILQGSEQAKKYANALTEIVRNPQAATIKWDGGIALFFGRNQQGQFFITDKYMPAKGVYPTSPQGWRDYDVNRGANRTNLYEKIESLWPGLEASVGNTNGIFKGDLMADGEEMIPKDNNFIFRPTTVTYTIPADSYLGRLMTNKVALIVVHEFAGRPWDGKTGLANVSNVAVVPPNINMTFALPNGNALLSRVVGLQSVITNYGTLADEFVAGLDNVARGYLGTYLNHVRTQQTKDTINVWLKTHANNKQYQNLIGDGTSGYMAQNKAGLDSLYKIWQSIFEVKVEIEAAFESQIQGFNQTTDAGPGGEGMVFPTSLGLIKLINPNFGKAHFAKPG